ncbi:uncharacterized protein LOC142973906 [Anticarsia gemmatalis]|uniref:uncharacterized protein LOC142973906 n=1 Tax=Anticarsia gemmatalis TaxID=129554 RepID=UPI003F764E8C
MPNTRRRKFSVQNEIAGRQSSKIQNDSSHNPDAELKITGHGTPKKSKNKMYANSSRGPPVLEIVAECESTTSTKTPEENSTTTLDKDITASSTNIDQESSALARENASADQLKEPDVSIESQKRRDPRQVNRERTPLRRDKHPRQHRIKVRSPKRRMVLLEQSKPTELVNHFCTKRESGTIAINWEEEYVVENVESLVEPVDDDERPSTHSLDDMCRICHGGDSLTSELGRLISACSCRGTVGRVHVKCLERWLTESGKSRCELCGTRYATRRVHRYGVPRALVMWILSQNAKQLMVDSLGIMLMSPLAVLAAWLSGRTLAGLMTQESHVTPWPLASTFVLACMTLVCYYCWIVSAATRHALGWWIWYRSQYEVRLQLQENDE